MPAPRRPHSVRTANRTDAVAESSNLPPLHPYRPFRRFSGVRPSHPSATKDLTMLRTSLLTSLCLLSAACKKSHTDDEQHGAHGHGAAHTIVATSPLRQDVRVTRKYVSQIHSRRHIELRALERGYLEQVLVDEGQRVERGQLLFKLLPVLYKAKLHGDQAELLSAEIKLRNTEQLFREHVVSDQEVALARAEVEKAKAKVELAQAELSFTEIRAPFAGIVDRQFEQQGSLCEEGDMLTTVSDNTVMWAYFNVPEADYLDFHERQDEQQAAASHQLRLPDARLQLKLANGRIFDQVADETVTVESTFHHETGNILFRADFPNPRGLLRHGQTGTLLLQQTLASATVIPQRATFEVLDKLYVFVVDDQGLAHQRRITVAHEQDDVFVVEDGLACDEKIVLDGVRQVREGEPIVFEFRDPKEVLKNLKHRAE
jgi:membrane fusion protein (multidrug efflux system)